MIVPVFLPHIGCGQRCAYCNQYLITNNTLNGEADVHIAAAMAAVVAPVEVALYGGNVLGLESGRLEVLLRLFEPYRDRISGLRISAKPGPVNEETVRILKEHRVRTIELGIPTVNDRILGLLGRGHTAEDFFHSFRLLRQEGFEVGTQVMVGLPGERFGDLRETVSAITRLAPPFIRIYPLIVIEDTLLFEWFKAGAFSPDTVEAAVAKACFIYVSAWKHNIKTIKMGLTENEVLKEKIAAGPYHPAFGYLVKSEAFRLAVLKVCADVGVHGEVAVGVHDSDVPHLVGFKRTNIDGFREEGISARWVTDRTLETGHFTIDGEGRRATGSLVDALAMIPF